MDLFNEAVANGEKTENSTRWNLGDQDRTQMSVNKVGAGKDKGKWRANIQDANGAFGYIHK